MNACKAGLTPKYAAFFCRKRGYPAFVPLAACIQQKSGAAISGSAFLTYDRQPLIGATQKGHDLRSRADSVGRELAAAGAGGNAVFSRPRGRPGIVAARGNVGKAARALRLRRACRALSSYRAFHPLCFRKPLHFYREKKRRNYAPEIEKFAKKRTARRIRRAARGSCARAQERRSIPANESSPITLLIQLFPVSHTSSNSFTRAGRCGMLNTAIDAPDHTEAAASFSPLRLPHNRRHRWGVFVFQPKC